jgi:hypothetical protein
LAAAGATPKQTLEKSGLIMVPCGALFLLFFYFKTSANKLVDLIGDLKVALGELMINVVAWISGPNESRDFYKKLTASPEPGIASLQEYEGSAANARVL